MTSAAATKNEKAEYQIDVQLRTQLLDKIYTKTREKVRERQGMITHDTAMQLVPKEDLQKIKEERCLMNMWTILQRPNLF